MSRLTYNVADAAEILGVSPGLLYSQVRNGQLRAIRFGRKVVITRATLEEILGHPIESHAAVLAERPTTTESGQ